MQSSHAYFILSKIFTIQIKYLIYRQTATIFLHTSNNSVSRTTVHFESDFKG